MNKISILFVAFFLFSLVTNAQVNSSKNSLPSLPQALTGCGYSNFESGQVFGWTVESGNINSINLPCDTCAKTAGGVYKIVNHASTVAGICSNGVDTYGGFPVVESNYGGNFSMLLNNIATGSKMQRAFFTFVVDNSASMFIVQYAAVIQSGGHALNQEPYFSVKLIDSTTNTIIPCSQYLEQAPSSGNIPGWNNSPVDATVYYKPWTTDVFYISSLVGHKLTLQYVVSDCDQGGHFGYAYIDANCLNGGPQITSSKSLCTITDTTTLSGPAGYLTYNWSGPVTGNTQTLKTGTPGNYTLTTTSASGCPAPVLYYNLMRGSVPTALAISTASNSVCSGSPVTLTASGAVSYAWSNNANSATTNTVSVSPIVNTTYTVDGSDSAGCVNTATISINTIATPTVSYTLLQDAAPFTWDAYPTYPANLDSAVWNWGDGTSLNALYPTHAYSAAGKYNICVTVTDANGCSGSYCQNDSIYRLANSTSGNMVYVNIYGNGATGITSSAFLDSYIQVYPNPANNMLYVDCKSKNATVFISDLLGNKIKQQLLENEKTAVDISYLSQGVYLISVKKDTGIITKKFVVQR